MKKQSDNRNSLGWVAVIFSTVVTCGWAFWGIFENFHEGWYFESLWLNLGMMFIQYLSPMLIFMSVTIISIFWPRFGFGLHGLIAIAAIWFFDAFSNAATFLIIVPLMGLGAMYLFSRLQQKKLAASLSAGLPLLTLIISGLFPAVRVSQRLNDGNRQAQLVQGNGVALIWAPAGPGWPRDGDNWYGAQHACQHLSADGLSWSPISQDIWRLPTVGEAVKSMSRHGQNSGGEWDAKTSEANYERLPDKESPLWDIYSQVIYWWTATEVDEDKAFIIVYDGKVWPRAKDFGPGYLGFRCVK